MSTELPESDGVYLKSIAETVGFDPIRTWGEGPLLLIKASEPSGQAPFMFTTPKDPEHLDHACLVSTTELLKGGGPLSAYLSRRAAVLPIRKSKRNAWTEVTVGRARNNDIRLSDTGVSKVHAYILPPSGWPMVDGDWKIRDCWSTNGTFILTGSGPVAVPMKDGVLLRAGMEVRFGTVDAIFLDPDTLRSALDFAKKQWELVDKEVSRKKSSDTDTAVRRPGDPEVPTAKKRFDPQHEADGDLDLASD